MLATVALLGACGDDNDDETSSNEAASDTDTSSTDGDVPADNAGDDASSGAVVDPAPAGTATVSIDGQNISFEEVLAGGCSISDDAITYGFVAADGVTTLAAGLKPTTASGWAASPSTCRTLTARA